MNLREIRLGLTRYPADALLAFARTSLADQMASYPTRRDLAAQVSWLLEAMERRNRLIELESIVNIFVPLLRKLLLVGFSESDIYRFMYDTPEFREVVQSIGYGKTKGVYIDLLIEHCEQRPELYPLLFDWMRETNPIRYTNMFLNW